MPTNSPHGTTPAALDDTRLRKDGKELGQVTSIFPVNRGERLDMKRDGQGRVSLLHENDVKGL